MEFYRYDELLYGTTKYPDVTVICSTYYLVKETPKGYWISSSQTFEEDKLLFIEGRKRWISKTSDKKFAYPTKRQALKAYILRRNKQIWILNAKINIARIAIDEATKLLRRRKKDENHEGKDEIAIDEATKLLRRRKKDENHEGKDEEARSMQRSKASDQQGY